MRKPTLLGAISATALLPLAGIAAAEDGAWMRDAITGCEIWSIDQPAQDDGVTWSGACVDGKATGEGVLIWWDGQGLEGRYRGAMQAGMVHGEGVLHVRDDVEGGFHEFLGSFVDGRAAGRGVLRLANGDRFYGELLDGPEHVKGLYLTAGGQLFQGEFADGKAVGTIIATYSDESGERYAGEAASGARNGYGVLREGTDDLYAGRFVEGLPDGAGVHVTVGGETFLGQFAGGRPNGFGTSIDAEGNAVQGMFEDGEPVGTVLVTLADGTQQTMDANEELNR